MRKTGLVLLILTSLLAYFKAEAQDQMGCEITWTCVGQDSFLLKLITYRDCNACPMYSSQINIKCAATGAVLKQVNLGLGSVVDITPVCNNSCNSCQSPSCSFPYGIDKRSFQSIVSLSTAGSCCNVILNWEWWSRSFLITTGSANQNFYYEAKLNRCLSPCDNSPQFSNTPVMMFCSGQDVNINHGVYDTDIDSTGKLSDSIVCQWAQPLKAAGTPITYTGQYAYNLPIYFYGFPNAAQVLPNGLHLDIHTGEIQFRPMKAEVTVMAVQFNEFRNGIKIGEIMRDLTVYVINCPSNYPPSITTPNNVRSKSICPGDTVTFSFSTTDPNTNDSVTLSWNNALPGATWTHNNGQTKRPTATLTWVPTASQSGSLPYNFTVTAKDNACPLRAQFTQSYQVFINPVPEASITISDSGCGKYLLRAIPTSGNLFNSNYSWSSSNFAFSPDTGSFITQNLVSGNYPIILEIKSPGCSRNFYDTFFVDTIMSVSLPSDTTVCINSAVLLQANVTNAKHPYTLQWGTGTNTTFNGDTNNSKLLNVSSDTTINIRAAYNSFTCLFDEISLKVHKNKISLPADTFFCDLNHVITPDFSPDKAAFSSFRWYRNALPTVVDYDANLNVFDTGLFSCEATDTFGCAYSDSIRVHQNPAVVASAPDTSICLGENVNIDADIIPNHYYSFKWWLNNKLLSSSAGLTVSPLNNTQYKLVATEILNGISCSDTHHITVTVNPLPVFAFEKFNLSCAKGEALTLDSFVKVNGKRVIDGIWTCPDEPSQVGANIFFSQTAFANINPGYKLAYSYLDNGSGCLNTEFVYLKVYPKPAIPQITVSGDTSFCYGGSVSLAASATASHYKWSSGDTMKQVTIKTTGNYSLSVANAYGCYSDHSKTVNVMVYPKAPKPSISLSATDSFLKCNMASGYYEWYYRPDTFSSYTYINNNSGAINPKLYCKKCYFNVIYTDTNHCESDTSYPFYFLVNSIDQIKQNPPILFYPNPAHSQLFIENSSLRTTSLILTDILGNTLLQTTINPGKNEINVTHYKSGMYFIFVDGVIAGKIMIE